MPLSFCYDFRVLRYSIMVIVSPSKSEHSIVVAGREYSGDLTLTIRDDYSKDTKVVDVEVTADGSYLELEFFYWFNEEGWYAIALSDANNKPVYRGKIYATDQVTKKYDILKDKYTADLDSSNQFMTL